MLRHDPARAGLEPAAAGLAARGHRFRPSANGVRRTEAVPPGALRRPG